MVSFFTKRTIQEGIQEKKAINGPWVDPSLRGSPKDLPELKIDEDDIDDEEVKGGAADGNLGYDRNQYWSKFIRGYNDFARSVTSNQN